MHSEEAEIVPGAQTRHDQALLGFGRRRLRKHALDLRQRAGILHTPAANGGAAIGALKDLLNRSIDDVGLSVRSVNSLKNSSIRTLADLVQYREEDLLKVKNVGEKALGEIAELLRREGLNFGMKLEEVDGELRVADPGAVPQALPTEGGEDE